MFDAKSILDILMKGAQPAPAQRTQNPSGGFGDLGDLLGKVLQGGQTGGAQTSQGGGGLGDILGQLQKQLGTPAPQANAAPSQSGGGSGGLGDILGQLQKQLGGQGGQPGQGGGLLDVLGQILGQATSGVKEGAGRIDDMTGASGRARDAVGQATGKSPEELLAQVQEWIRNNPGLAAAGAGGLGSILLGTRTGRGMVGSAARLGALAMIGGLAYKAWQNYQEGKPLIADNDPRRAVSEAAPAGSGFEPAAISNDTATLYLRAMIAAAAADGRIDAQEQQKLLGSVQQAGIGGDAHAFLQREIDNPASPAELAASVRSPQEAVQVYTAARLAIEPDNTAEDHFLKELAQRLGIDADLAAHIDATAGAAAA